MSNQCRPEGANRGNLSV
uniref:Uncharacterized protein n=1 Tax=Anguilla anguilla TaxID=7936 RepID=A0A0E9V621_ANGAN